MSAARTAVMSDITMSVTMQSHPAAEIFPMMAGVDFDGLVADIRKNGQREPIVIYNDMILDGRHRYKACQQLGVEPTTSVWDGKGTLDAFVISKNLHRRHLNESQRAMIAKKLAKLKVGDNQHSKEDRQICRPSQEEAAKLLHVSPRSVRHAAIVQEQAAPEMVEAVERGEIPVSTAARLVHMPKARQREIAFAGKKNAAKVAKQVRMRRSHQRERQQREPAQEETQHDQDLNWLLQTWERSCETAQAAFLERLQLIRVSHPIVKTTTPRPQVINAPEVAALQADK
jgi:ParB-like chromosome segregation protein Spo0J